MLPLSVNSISWILVEVNNWQPLLYVKEQIYFYSMMISAILSLILLKPVSGLGIEVGETLKAISI